MAKTAHYRESVLRARRCGPLPALQQILEKTGPSDCAASETPVSAGQRSCRAPPASRISPPAGQKLRSNCLKTPHQTAHLRDDKTNSFLSFSFKMAVNGSTYFTFNPIFLNPNDLGNVLSHISAISQPSGYGRNCSPFSGQSVSKFIVWRSSVKML